MVLVLLVLLLAVGEINAPPLVERAYASQTWWNTTYGYRSTITLTYGSSVTDANVLYNTPLFGSLYSAGKLRSDCNDIRFVDNSNNPLPYFLEVCDISGGNSLAWIKVTLTPPSTIIWMYYGNPNAQSESLTWSGSLVVMTTLSSTPSGWMTLTAINGLFPYGSATSGQTGGSAHTHSFTATIGSASSTSPSYNYDVNLIASVGHTHTFSGSTSSDTVLPPYMTYIFMYMGAIPYNFPANSIVMTNGPVPSGWSQVTELMNHIPRGGAYTGVGGGSATHTHIITGTLSGASGASNGLYGSGPYVVFASPGHTHSVGPTTTGSASSYPDTFSVVFIGNSALQPIQSNMVLMFQGDLPPLGWTRVTGLDNRYPLGSDTFGVTGSGAHTHPFSGTSGYASSLRDHTSSTSYGSSGALDHTHLVSGTTVSTTNQPPYYTLIFGQRVASLPTITVGSEEGPMSCTIPPSSYAVTFATNIGSDSSGTVVTVNGVAEIQSGLTSTTASSITYTFSSIVPSTVLGKRYVWQSTASTPTGQTGQTGSFTPIVATTVTATYKVQYLLTMETIPAGGTIITSPSVSGPPYWFDSGQSVTLTAALSGYTFQSWSGSGTGSYTGSSESASVAMNNAITEIADFRSGIISVTVTSYPPAGSGFIKVDDTTYDAPHTFTWTVGSTHTLEAITPVSCGTGCQYVFTQWSDGATTPVYASYATPSSTATITAIYKTQYQITIGAQSIDAPMSAPPTLLMNIVWPTANPCLLPTEEMTRESEL